MNRNRLCLILVIALTTVHAAHAADSVLVGWGLNADGQSTTPPGLGVIVQIAAGEAHSVVLRADGSVHCWGWNPYGQCDVPTNLPPIRRIDAGYNGTIALGLDGRVRCWGANGNGECNVPASLENVVQIAGGGYHNVALRSDGVIVGWGWNGVGQITTPAGIGPVKAIGAGHAHTIAVRADGTVWCWGRNDSTECSVPPNVAGVVEVSSGGFNSLARGADGTAFAWGNPGWNQGTVPPGGEIAKQVAGGHYHSMILRPDRTVVTWGGNWEGQGVTPPGLKNVAYIAAGGYHNLALLASDEDGDGIDNTVDNCVFTANPDQSDIDGDGIGDYCDGPDSDGDGVADGADGCPNDPAKTSPGTCGCGERDLDLNGDGIIDCPGQPIEWRSATGGNGHWYTRVANSSAWSTARTASESQGGHLVTITSAAEDAFVASLDPSSACFMGGFQALDAPDYVEPAGGWRWVTGEPWTYTNWAANEPNNSGAEHFLQRWNYGQWSDTHGEAYWHAGYIAEWSADCNNDGIVDYGQCRDGSLPDYNGNNIPDCCESGSPCVVGNYPVQWRVAEGGNGHWYQLISEVSSWAGSRGSAQARGADLCSITTSAENNRVLALVGRASEWCNDGAGYWLGGFRQEGQWRWTTGESFSFSYWGCGNPGEVQTHIQWYRVPTGCPPLGTVVWDDQFPEGCPALQGNPGFVAEWSADCNGDGIVDYGQILKGQLADANADGIPDICQQPTCVDADIYRDFNVNGADLGILLSQWGPNTPLTESDINNDGVVNGADLGLLLSFWGACP